MSSIGYACVNMTLSKEVTTSRTMVKKTFETKGLDYVSEVALKNVTDLLTILEWNNSKGIKLFRLGSGIIPWGNKIDITQLKDYNAIVAAFKRAGDYAKANNIRVNTHPGHFNVLTSPSEKVVLNTISDLDAHGVDFDLMQLPQTPYSNINIHCNGVYGDKKSAMDRFCDNFKRLSPSTQKRLTVENDDKASMYSVKDLMYIHDKIGIPIVFDYHHHKFNTGGLSEEEAVKLAASTWPKGITPEIHYSESKAEHESNPKLRPQAHSDYINSLPNMYGLDLDIMVESKAKELAILPFLDTFKQNRV